MLLLPVRCWTCGKLIGRSNVRTKYVELLQDGMEAQVALDRCGLRKYCCRRMLLSHVEVSGEILSHSRLNTALAEKEANDIVGVPSLEVSINQERIGVTPS